MDKTSFFILNIFINSFLAFFTALLLIEGVIFLLRIKQGRGASFLRMMPILKLPLDLVRYDFSRWSYLQGINPLHCEEGSRTLFISFGWRKTTYSDCLFSPLNSAIQFTTPEDMTFTLSDIIGYLMNPTQLKLFSISIVFLSACFFIRKLISYYYCMKRLNFIVNQSGPILQKKYNPKLMARIQNRKCPIITSPLIPGSAFVAGLFSPKIYISSHLSNCLSCKEYEAVLAHELEHIRNLDVLTRFVVDLISSLFWWVPAKRLQNKIEEGQEISCDSKCKGYGVDSLDLASAIWKAAKHTHNASVPVVASCLTQHKALTRVKMLLYPNPHRLQKTLFLFTCLAISLAFLLILLGRFWIF